MGIVLILKSFYYVLSILFIWTQLFQWINKLKINDISSQYLNPKIWIFFYISKIIYFFWIIGGSFTEKYYLFFILIFLYLMRFFIFITKNFFYIILYDLISKFVTIIILFLIMISGVALLL
jgi:hypothetical protein